jgi:hypothetical protein
VLTTRCYRLRSAFYLLFSVTIIISAQLIAVVGRGRHAAPKARRAGQSGCNIGELTESEADLA